MSLNRPDIRVHHLTTLISHKDNEHFQSNFLGKHCWIISEMLVMHSFKTSCNIQLDSLLRCGVWTFSILQLQKCGPKQSLNSSFLQVGKMKMWRSCPYKFAARRVWKPFLQMMQLLTWTTFPFSSWCVFSDNFMHQAKANLHSEILLKWSNFYFFNITNETSHTLTKLTKCGWYSPMKDLDLNLGMKAEEWTNDLLLSFSLFEVGGKKNWLCPQQEKFSQVLDLNL